jgi:hypothetical protein
VATHTAIAVDHRPKTDITRLIFFIVVSPARNNLVLATLVRSPAFQNQPDPICFNCPL